MKKNLFDAPQFGYDDIYFEESCPMALTAPLLTSNGVIYKNSKNFVKVNAVWDTGSDISSIPLSVAEFLKLKYRYTGRKLNTINGFVDERLCTTNFIVCSKNNEYAFQYIECEARINEAPEASLLVGMDIIGNGKFLVYHSPGFLNLSFKTL